MMTNGRKWTMLFLCFLLFSCGDVTDGFYKTLGDAKKSGDYEKGWLPRILPDSSYEIYERHDLDTNAVWVRFKVNKKDIVKLSSQLEEVQSVEIDSIQFPEPPVKWWPREINKSSIRKKQNGLTLLKHKRIILYSDNKQKVVPAFFIIDTKSATVYYWQ